MKLNNIQHIFFDLDHTLWDFDKNSALTFEICFKEEKLNINLSEFLEAYTPINQSYWKLYQDNLISKEALRTGRLKDCFELLNLPISSCILENLSNNYIRHLPSFNNLLEDTQDVLQYLYPKYTLHIITNGFNEVQQKKLAGSNLTGYFSTVTTSEEAGVKKPHPGIFNQALEKSKALARESLMIGDSYEADILGAKNAGLKTVFFDYYGTNTEIPTRSIQKLKELKKCL